MKISSRFRSVAVAVIAAAGVSFASAAHADSGSIRFAVYKAAFFIGGTGGQGTLIGGDDYYFKKTDTPDQIKAGIAWINFKLLTPGRGQFQYDRNKSGGLPVGLPWPESRTSTAAGWTASSASATPASSTAAAAAPRLPPAGSCAVRT